jgi:hypothetical protein
MAETIEERIIRIDQGVADNGAALAAFGDILNTLMRQQGEIITLLTPDEADSSRVSLGELLAQMIQQNQELLALTHVLVGTVNRLEQNLPRVVAKAIGGAGHRA